MKAYFSRTGTRTTLAAAKLKNWGLLVSASGVWRTEGFEDWVADSGAWSFFNKKEPFDEALYVRFLRWCIAQSKQGNPPRWIALPDIVAGGKESLDLSLKWYRRLKKWKDLKNIKFMLVVQDGMDVSKKMMTRLRKVVGPSLGIFVGGTTEWKIATMPFWGKVKKELFAELHVGRVNSAKRMEMAGRADADSVDGTSVTQFPKTLPMLESARHSASLAASQIDIEDYIKEAA